MVVLLCSRDDGDILVNADVVAFQVHRDCCTFVHIDDCINDNHRASNGICCRSVSAHLAAGAGLLQLGAWITDPKGGLMCAAAGSSHHHHQQNRQQQLDHGEDSIIWGEARATVAARAALTAEMQAPPSLSALLF